MNVHATTLWTFHPIVVGFQSTLPKRLVGNIGHEHDRALFGRDCRQLKQKAGPDLPVSLAGMPETVIAYFMKAFRQHMKQEATQELNTL